MTKETIDDLWGHTNIPYFDAYQTLTKQQWLYCAAMSAAWESPAKLAFWWSGVRIDKCRVQF